MTTLLIISVALLLLLSGVYFLVFNANDRRLITQRYQTIEHEGAERRYRVKLPEGYSDSRQYPMVIAFHGYRDRGKQLEFYSGLSNLADREEFIVLYPEGLNRSWNGQVCCGYSYERGTDDIGFIKSLSDKVSSAYAVDSGNIHLVGFSNGGLMVQRLLQEAPEIFSAGATVMSSAGVEGEMLAIDKAEAPLLMVNGAEDNYAPLSPEAPKSSGFQFISAEAAIEYWQEQYGATQTERQEADDYIRTVYGRGKAPLEWHIYKNIGHRWPDWRLMHPFTDVPESTERMWEFLSSNS